jgi:hypothetical protein
VNTRGPGYKHDFPFACECGKRFETAAELDVHKGLDAENDSLIGRTFDDFALDSEPAPICGDALEGSDGEGV